MVCAEFDSCYSEKEDFKRIVINLLQQLNSRFQKNIQFQILNDSNSNKSSFWIAKYQVRLSSPSKGVISFNSHWLSKRDFNSTSDLILLKRAVIHEFIHALDCLNIQKTTVIYHTRNQIQGLLEELKYVDYYWIIMHYFNLLRNEGIALYAEDLLNDELDQSVNIDFEQSFISDLRKISRWQQNNSISGKESLQLFDSLYNYAGLIAKSLFPNHGSSSETIIEQMTGKDLSIWIWMLFQKEQWEELVDVFPDKDQIKKLIEIQSVTALHAFLDSFEPDYKHIDGASKTESFSDLKGVVLENLALKLELYGKNQLLDRISQYISAPNDCINDQIPFIGYLDDMILLSKFEKLNK